jgi:hypothetical protein
MKITHITTRVLDTLDDTHFCPACPNLPNTSVRGNC